MFLCLAGGQTLHRVDHQEFLDQVSGVVTDLKGRRDEEEKGG